MEVSIWFLETISRFPSKTSRNAITPVVPALNPSMLMLAALAKQATLLTLRTVFANAMATASMTL